MMRRIALLVSGVALGLAACAPSEPGPDTPPKRAVPSPTAQTMFTPDDPSYPVSATFGVGPKKCELTSQTRFASAVKTTPVADEKAETCEVTVNVAQFKQMRVVVYAATKVDSRLLESVDGGGDLVVIRISRIAELVSFYADAGPTTARFPLPPLRVFYRGAHVSNFALDGKWVKQI